MNVGTPVFLADPVNTGQALAVCRVVKVFAVVDASVGCRQGNAQPGRVDLGQEDLCIRISLEVVNDRPPVLDLNVAVYAGEADLFLLQAGAY